MQKLVLPSHPDGYRLLPYSGPNPGYNRTILDRIAERMNYAIQKHSQIMTVPLVIRYPSELCTVEDNDCFQSFVEEYIRWLRNQELDPQYVWVAERHLASHPHYHLILILNGNRIRFFKVPPVEADIYWGRALISSYYYTGEVRHLVQVCSNLQLSPCHKHGYLIRRDNTDLFNHVVEIYSYYAKINTKGTLPHGCREFGASNLPKEEVHHG